ncbi:hypothetical protein K438DRAFT_1551645, partial [Mycena galopus ATCC 62051]
NDPPHESQIPFLRDFISNGHARMVALDARIALLQSSLDQLLAKKHKLDVEISIHEMGLSPLRSMPAEIMSCIFSFTLPPHHPDTESAPWTVSVVCVRWHAIAIFEPRLW